MAQNESRYDAAVALFENTGMSESEARAYVIRELHGLGRQEAAQTMDADPSTVDTLHQRAKQKATLPDIVRVDPNAETGHAERRAIEIWFENEALLRYVVREHETGEVAVYEEIYAADDPASLYEKFDISIEPDELERAALESLDEYVRTYKHDPEALRHDWPHVFEAITLYGA